MWSGKGGACQLIPFLIVIYRYNNVYKAHATFSNHENRKALFKCKS